MLVNGLHEQVEHRLKTEKRPEHGSQVEKQLQRIPQIDEQPGWPKGLVRHEE